MSERIPFREHHILTLLKGYSEDDTPLDLHIRNYFRDHKALGSKDRLEISDTVYGIIRWRGLLDYLCQGRSSWEARYECYRNLDLEQTTEHLALEPHLQVSFPKNLYDRIVQSLGKEAGHKTCYESNYPAPTTVRINPLKTTREAMLAKWEPDYAVTPCRLAPFGIVFEKKLPFFSLPEFKEGLFEVQDEGSQLVAELVKVKPGEQVMDFCAGSGGKTLAFAYKMQGRGQIYLHDVRQWVLTEAKKRLKRAGIQNAQILLPASEKMKKLKKKMDWVLVDAPCSGTGTLRRNPDMKWKFSEEMLHRLTSSQRVIVEKALSFVKPGGKIVFATCSLLKEENQDQLQHFLNTYDLDLAAPPFQSLPVRGGMDGFFAAVFTKKQT